MKIKILFHEMTKCKNFMLTKPWIRHIMKKRIEILFVRRHVKAVLDMGEGKRPMTKATRQGSRLGL